MPFIIDGTNLLRAVENTDTDVITDIAMCNTIARYLLLIAQKGELVFDGTGPPDKARFDNISNLEVSFAGLAVEADDVIEDKINASTAPRTLTVVSSDRRLRNAAKARRAVSIKCEAFWDQLQQQLKKKKEASSEPQAKRSGLTQGETDQWLKFFQIDD
jgi:predicted RNA-binding protein with PIN domain